jgi:AcrR family transcriptional regulator
LLDATAQVIADRGTSGVSFADIAKAAGCSHGLPGYLFGSKSELLLALVDDVLRALRSQLFEPAIAGERGLMAVTDALRAFLESLVRPSSYTRAIYVLLGEAAGGPPELHAALVAYQDGLQAYFRQMVEDGVARGEIRPDVDPAVEAVVLVGLARGIGQQAVLEPGSVDARAVAAETVAWVTRSLAVDSKSA